MKRGTKLIVMSCILVMLCALTYYFHSLDLNNTEDDITNETTTIFSVDYDSITALSLTNKAETLSFNRADSLWKYNDDDAFPLDTDALNIVLLALCSIDSSKVIPNVEDYSQYGLNEPPISITLTADTDYQINIGDKTSLGDALYISINDGNVYLTDTGFYDYFDCSLEDFLKEEEIPSMNDIDSILITTNESTLNIYHDTESTLENDDGTVFFWFDKDSGEPLSTSYVDNFTDTLTGFSWSKCIDYNADETALSEYGFDNPLATMSIDYIETSDDAETIQNFTVEIGSIYDDDYYYAKIKDSNMVYLIGPDLYNAISQTTVSTLMPTASE